MARNLGLGGDAAPRDVEKEIHRIFQSAFTTPDGKKAFNILMNELQYFSTTHSVYEDSEHMHIRHVLQDFAQFVRIELIGAVDTVALTNALLNVAQKDA